MSDSEERKDESELSALLAAYSKAKRVTVNFKSFLPKLMGDLTEREKAVIVLRFGINDFQNTGWTLEDVGKSLGMTRERVRIIERKAKDKMSQSRKLKWKRYEEDIKRITDS